MNQRSTASTLVREQFRTSRLLEYFSEKELTLQTGHEPERWPEVVVKELVDNALDACEEADVLPEITVSVDENSIAVADNGPGLPNSVIEGVLDYSVRSSSKDSYISPTRGAQGNALKTVIGIPYVLSGCRHGEVTITSQGQRHQVLVSVDRIAQRPEIRHEVKTDDLVRSGTHITVTWPDSAGSDLVEARDRILQMVSIYGLLNPHAQFAGLDTPFTRVTTTCRKWVASEPTSAHWYDADQLRALMASYIAHERDGGRGRTVREFVSEFRGLSSTAKQKAILARAGVAGVHLRDLVADGDIDHSAVEALLDAMRAESRPVKPRALGALGEPHLTAWLEQAGAETVRYQKAADIDEDTGRPFLVEIAFGVRPDDDDGLRLVTGINWAPTVVNPFRALNPYGLSLGGLLERQHIRDDHPVTYILHLACPHLNYTDRGKSSLEAL